MPVNGDVLPTPSSNILRPASVPWVVRHGANARPTWVREGGAMSLEVRRDGSRSFAFAELSGDALDEVAGGNGNSTPLLAQTALRPGIPTVTPLLVAERKGTCHKSLVNNRFREPGWVEEIGVWRRDGGPDADS